MKKMKIMLCGIALLLLVPVIGYQAYDANTTLNAETAVIDDSPLGEKIVDIDRTKWQGESYIGVTDEGEVYTWGDNVLGNLSDASIPLEFSEIPRKVYFSQDGIRKTLSNIKQVEIGGLGKEVNYGNVITFFALSNDGKLYVWGDNRRGGLPLPERKVYVEPVEVTLDANIHIDRIFAGATVTYFLTDVGEVYVSGNDANNNTGILGLGENITITNKLEKIEKMYGEFEMPKVVDISMNISNTHFISVDGGILAIGVATASGALRPNEYAQGIKNFWKPRYCTNSNNQTLTNGTQLFGTIFAGSQMVRTESDILVAAMKQEKSNSHTSKFYPIETFVPNIDALTQNVLDNLVELEQGTSGSFLALTKQHQIYVVSHSTFSINQAGVSGGEFKVSEYDNGLITSSYQKVKKALGKNRVQQDQILTLEGSVFSGAVKLGFGDIALTSTKKEDTSVYENEELYNGDVDITYALAKSAMPQVRYDVTDHVTNSTETGKTGNGTVSVSSIDERIHRTYTFYVDGMKDQLSKSITIDLYKKQPILSGIENNGSYVKGQSFTFDNYNGFSENTVQVTLTKEGGTSKPYTSGTVINEVGKYTLDIADQYGNTNSYSFNITNLPGAQSIKFTPKDETGLQYGHRITKKGEVIGTLSLVFAQGLTPSPIKTMEIDKTDSNKQGDNFEVINLNMLKVVNEDLNAGTYVVPIKGTDENDAPFSGDITITIAKATQTMAWDETSAKLVDNGIALGDEVTLGVKDALGNVNVTYGLKTPNSCITMTENKGKVTCIPNPASVTFTATPSGNDNYTSDPIELTVSISKKSISLKTVIRDSDSTFKDRVSVKVGDTTPAVKVVDVDGKEVSNLGTPELTFKKNGSVFADPTIESGTYTVEASYPSGSAADNYTITWTSKASLTVSDITIDENNASDYYTLTSDGKSYTPNTWTNQPIVITPVHKDFNLMSVENANTSSSSPYTYSVEGSKEVKLTFATADGAKASTKVTLNYDKTKPVMTSFQYDDVNSPVRAVLRSLFGFTHYFDQEKAVKFIGSDESTGSGVKEYTYEIVELNVDGSEITSSKKTGTLDSVNSVKLEMDKNYKITAKVIDNAGNPSEPMSETVQLNDEIGELSLSAVSDGTAYDGSKWTSKAITITLTGSNKSGVKKYQYSTDGTTFIDFTSSDGTITLPSPLTSIDNKTYTFRAVNNDTTTNDKTLSMKVDIEKPVIKVKGMIGNTLYDGSEVDTDVTIIPYQESDSLSDISYYYTEESSSKNTDPLTDTNWKKYTGVVSETRNGTHTYYVKGINGAGVQSDPADITIKIAKKEYTKVNVEVTSENQPYTSGTWAKHDITFTLSGGLSDESIITGYEVTTTRDGSRPSATAAWTSVKDNKKHVVTTNSEQETYWFRVLPVDPNGSISKGTLINLDVEKPKKPTFTMEEVNTNALARFVNAVSFGQWMKAGVKVTINSNDNISGLDHFTYEEITSDGRIEKQSTNGILYYEEDAKLTLQAKAYDKAGNVSEVSEESGSILIDTIPPVIEGVKDQDVYKKYYYVYRTISYHDNEQRSGIDTSSPTIKKDGVNSELSQGHKVTEIGNYEVSVKDIAGNEAIVRFQLVPLPKIETEIDGTDESKEIIEQIEKELEEERENLTPDEIKDFEKWIEDATKKWESERKKKLEDKETGTIVEGEGNTSFDPNTVLIVDEIDESKVPSLPRKAINVYDVYMKKGDTVIQPDGSVKVYLPYSEEEEPIIYEIDEHGNVKEIKGTKENGYVSFITDKLKKYAISNKAQEENKEPDTGTCTAGPDGKLGTEDDVCGGGNGKDEPTKNEDGSVDVPDGGTIHFPDKEIDAPDGAHINPDGSVELPDGTEYDKDGNKKPKVCDIKNGIVLNKDSDGDGLPDINLDIDNDCFAELNIDVNNDGIPDLDIDSDGDGKADINIDVNGDGYANLNIVKLTKWTPDKNDCEYEGFHYDTMSGLKADSNIDSDGDGKADTNITDKDGNPIDTSVKSNYNSSNTQGVGGAGTGDSTKWFIWTILMVLTLGTMGYHIYRAHKRRNTAKM